MSRKQHSNRDIDRALSEYTSEAQLASLYGADHKQSIQINQDSNFIDWGRALGAALGGVGGYMFSAQVGATSPNHDYSINAKNLAGAAAGAGIGALLGNYINFKVQSNIRGTNDIFRFRHLRKPAQLAALQGLSPQIQKQWNTYGRIIDRNAAFGPVMARSLTNKEDMDNFITLHKLKNN